MKKLIIIVLLLGLFTSCHDKKRYEMSIIIKNKTNSTINVRLFPKNNYLYKAYKGLYSFSDLASGYRDTYFQINTERFQNIYITGNISMKPSELLTQVFDSIEIVIAANNYKIEFSPDTVIGYKINPYKSDSSWIYEINNYDMPIQRRRNPVESHDYIFVISKTNIEESTPHNNGS